MWDVHSPSTDHSEARAGALNVAVEISKDASSHLGPSMEESEAIESTTGPAPSCSYHYSGAAQSVNQQESQESLPPWCEDEYRFYFSTNPMHCVVDSGK